MFEYWLHSLCLFSKELKIFTWHTIPFRISPHSAIHHPNFHSKNIKTLLVPTLSHQFHEFLCLSFIQQTFIETTQQWISKINMVPVSQGNLKLAFFLPRAIGRSSFNLYIPKVTNLDFNICKAPVSICWKNKWSVSKPRYTSNSTNIWVCTMYQALFEVLRIQKWNACHPGAFLISVMLILIISLPQSPLFSPIQILTM